MKEKQIKLNLGCGTKVIPGFDNIDNSFSILLDKLPFSQSIKYILWKLKIIKHHHYETIWPPDIIWLDVTRSLKYPDNSVDKIYSSHFLEHVTKEKAFKVLEECYRVLKPDGHFRLVVPDLLYYAQQYVKKTQNLLSQNPIPTDRQIHDYFLKKICGGWILPRRSGHLYMYDLPTLLVILKEVGFRNIQRKDYQDSDDPELTKLDNRPEDSIILEMTK